VTPSEPANNPWTLITRKEVYESPWISLSHHEVLNPAGNPGTYSVVHFKKLAIGVLPLDEEMNTWIVGQYRYPLGEYTWEIPEGGGERDVDPLVTAARELQEECGIIAREYAFLQKMLLSDSATDEVAYLYLARGLSFTDATPEENEELAVRKIPFEELYRMVCDGRVTDSLSVAAVLKVKLMLLEGTL
jgi:8-oxo-dGTP pyrophosphatase MutT (NUDIX family)